MKVVVPLDGSRWAEEAVRYIVRHFRPDELEIALVQVLEPQGNGHDSEVEEQHARAYLDMLAWELEDAGYQVKPFVLRGSAASLIAQLADVVDADLVVLTSHGQGQHHGQPTGRTAASILAQTSRPVLVIPVRHLIEVPGVPTRAHAAP